MNLYQLKEALYFMLRNETDGYLATVMGPRRTGLTAHMIFNSYGYYYATGRHFLIPKKHRRMIVEVAKDIDDAAGKKCKRFNWSETIPVSVSDSPKILLKGRKLKWAQSAFNPKEWNRIYRFIRKNRKSIEQYWICAIDSIGLLDAFGLIDRDGL